MRIVINVGHSDHGIASNFISAFRCSKPAIKAVVFAGWAGRKIANCRIDADGFLSLVRSTVVMIEVHGAQPARHSDSNHRLSRVRAGADDDDFRGALASGSDCVTADGGYVFVARFDCVTFKIDANNFECLSLFCVDINKEFHGIWICGGRRDIIQPVCIISNIRFSDLSVGINKAAAVCCGVPVIEDVAGVGWASRDASAERRVDRNFDDGFIGGAVIVDEVSIDRNSFELRDDFSIFG